MKYLREISDNILNGILSIGKGLKKHSIKNQKDINIKLPKDFEERRKDIIKHTMFSMEDLINGLHDVAKIGPLIDKVDNAKN